MYRWVSAYEGGLAAKEAQKCKGNPNHSCNICRLAGGDPKSIYIYIGKIQGERNPT